MKPASLLCLMILPASGLILIDGENPAANVETAPTGAYAGSGWQYQLRYFLFHGTMISPKHFLTAAHAGNSQTEVVQNGFFNGAGDQFFSIKPGSWQIIPGTDLAVFEIWETFENYAPLYTATNEVGKEIVISGRGKGRGADVAGRGWEWGDDSTRRSRWGRNQIDGITTSGTKSLLYFDFDNTLGRDEAGATSGDSGGGWFIKEGSTWKLAAVSFSVDSAYHLDPSDGNLMPFSATLHTVGGIYLGSTASGWTLIPTSGVSNNPASAAFYRKSHTYGSRVSSSAAELQAIINPAIAVAALNPEGRLAAWVEGAGVVTQSGPGDDPDGDGLTNLEEYFSNSQPSQNSDAVRPMLVEFLGNGVHRFTLRESLDLAGRGLSGTIESSEDLLSWIPQSGLTQSSNIKDLIKGRRTRILEVTPSGTGPRYYRLKIIL